MPRPSARLATETPPLVSPANRIHKLHPPAAPGHKVCHANAMCHSDPVCELSIHSPQTIRYSNQVSLCVFHPVRPRTSDPLHQLRETDVTKNRATDHWQRK